MLDHLVFATPDLAGSVRQFAAMCGVEPVPGGRHADWGTANFLVGLGGSAYLEIIGPDQCAAARASGRPLGIDDLTDAKLATWAIRTADIDGHRLTAMSGGYDPGPARSMSRVTSTGDLLRWRLTAPDADGFAGLVPFLIDWGDSPHPTSADLPQTPLLRFSASHPEPGHIHSALSALGSTLTIDLSNRAALNALIQGRNGPVLIT